MWSHKNLWEKPPRSLILFPEMREIETAPATRPQSATTGREQWQETVQQGQEENSFAY